MTLSDRRNTHDGRLGIAIAHAPAVEFVPVHLLQDTVWRRARMAVVNAVNATDELVSRLSGLERRILFEAASPLSLAIFRPVLERLQHDPRLESWFTASDNSCRADRIFGGAGIIDWKAATDSTGASLQGWGWVNGVYWLSQPTTLTFARSDSHTLPIQVCEDGVQFDEIVLSPTTSLNTPPGPPSNNATIVPKP